MSICSSDSSLKIVPLSQLYSWKKAKKLQKIAFFVESKAEFLVELKHGNSKSSFTLSIAKAKHGDSSETYENPSWLGWEMELKFVASFAASGLWV